MVELCSACKSALVYFSSDFASTRYYCPSCRKFYTIARASPTEKKTVRRPSPTRARRLRKKVAVRKVSKKTPAKRKEAPKTVKRKKVKKKR